MGPRRVIVLALALVAAAGCGEGAGTAPPAGSPAATVLVTRDFGATSMLRARVAPDQSALNALRRSARVGTSYGGRFVTAIDGLEGSKSGGWDWLYFVNGIDPGVGAADTDLHAGDVEWWDYRYWKDFIGVPAVIGAWPEPFVHGLDGRRPAVSVIGPPCAAVLRTALRRAGARLASGGSYDVRVATFAAAAPVLGAWNRWAMTVRVRAGTVDAYRAGGGWRTVTGARAVAVARIPGGVPGRSFEMLIAGADERSACHAAEAVATRPGSIRGTYTVAMDGDGNVLAAGGRG